MKYFLIISFALTINTVHAHFDFTLYATTDSINKVSTVLL